MAKKPRAPKKPAVELDLADLDQVAGGATTPLTTAQLNAVAGFDTSHTDLSATAVANGTAQAAVANIVAAGTGTETGAMHLLEAVSPQDNANQAQVLSSFAEQISTHAGHTGDFGLVGGEIAHQIAGGQITTASAMQGIDAAVGAHGITADHAMALLAGVAAGGSQSVQAAAGGEIVSMINHGYITAAQAMTDVTTAVSNHTMTGDQAVAMLAGMAANGTAALQSTAGHEITALVTGGQIALGQALADIDSAVGANLLTGDQAVGLLAGLASGTGATPAIQAAAGGEVASLIATSHVTAAQAVADIDSAVTGSVLTGPQAVSMLAGLAGVGGAAVQSSVNTEIASLISTAHVTADQAVTALATAGALSGTVAVESYAAAEIASLIAGNTVTAANAMTDINTAVTSHALTGDQAVGLLAGIAAASTLAVETAAIGEINTLIGAAAVTAAGVMTDIGNAVTSHLITGDQAIAVLAGLNATGTAATATAAAGEIVTLINGGQVSVASAMADIGTAVTSTLLTGAKALSLLTGVAGVTAGTSTIQAAAGGELAALIGTNAITATQAMTAINSAVVTSHTLTGDQAVALLAGAAASSIPAAATAAAAQLNTMIAAGTVTAAQAMTDIGNAVTAKALTGDQAVTALGNLIVAGSPAVQTAAAGQIVSLVNSGAVTAASAMTDIGNAVAAKSMTADQAMAALARIAAAGPAAVQAAVGGEVVALITSGAITAAQAMTDIGTAVTSTKSMTADQAVAVLLAITAAGALAVDIAAIGEINTLIGSAAVTAAGVMADIGNAVTSKLITGDQAIAVLAGLSATGAAATVTAATGEIVTLINGGLVSAANAMTAIGAAVTSTQLTGAQALSLLTAVAGVTAGTSTIQAAAGGEIAVLIGSNAITASQAMTAINSAVVTSHTLTGDQAIALLAGAAASSIAAAATAAAAQLNTMITNANVTTTQVMTDIGNAVTPNALSGDQAVTALTNLMAGGSAAVQTAAATRIVTLVSGGSVSAASAMTDIGNAVAAKSMTADQAVAVLARIAAASTNIMPSMSTVAGCEVAALIASGAITAAQAMTDIGTAVTSTKSMTGGQAVAMLAGTIAAGNASAQTAAAGELVALVNGATVTAGQVMNNIAYAVALNTLTGDQAVTVLTLLASAGSAAIQTAAADQLLSMVGNNVSAASAMADIGNAVLVAKTVTADQAIAWLARLSDTSFVATPAVQAAAGGEIAALIAGGAITAAQAMTDVAAAVAAKSLTGDEAVALLSGTIASGSAAAQIAAAGQIVAMINAATVTAAQVMSDIGNAVTAKTLTGDQAVTVLANIAAAGSTAVQTAAAGEILTLINAGAVTTASAMTDIGNAVAANAVTGDQAIALLGRLAGAGAAVMQAAVGGEIAALINAAAVTAAQAMADIGAAVSAKALTGDQAVTVLSSVMAAGAAAVQAAASGEVAALINNGSVTAANAMTDIGAAVTSKVLTGDQAVAFVAGIAGGGNATVQAAAGSEIATLIARGAVTATQAMTDVGNAVTAKSLTGDQAIVMLSATAATGSTAVQGAAVKEIVTLINAGSATAAGAVTDIVNAVTAKAVTGDQAVLVLAGLAGTGSAALNSAAVAQILAYINNNTVTPMNAMADIGKAATGSGAPLSGPQAMSVLTSLAAGGSAAVQVAVGTEIGALDGVIANFAPQSIASSVAAHTLTADQAVTVLTAASAAGSYAKGDAATALNSLITGNSITAAQAMTDIANAVSGKLLTGTQALPMLVTLGAIGSATVQAAAAGQVAALVTSGATTLASVMSTIDGGSYSNSVPQAMSMLMAVAGRGDVSFQSAAGAEIVTLVSANRATSAQAMTAIGNAVAGGTMTGAQAVSVLCGVAAKGPGSLIGAAGGEVAALIGSGALTPANAVASVSTAGLGSDQAAKLFAGMAATGNAAAQSAALGAILSLINSSSITVTAAMTDIANAVTPVQAVSVVLGLAGAGGAAVQPAAIAEIVTLINSNALTAAQAMASVVSTLGAAQAAPTLFAVAAAGSPAIQAAVGGEFAVLIGNGSLTAPNAIATIAGAVSSSALTGDQAVALLAGAVSGGNATAQSAAIGEILTLVNGGVVTLAGAMTDVAAALPPAQSIAVLLATGAAGGAAVQAAAFAEIVTLINTNVVSAAQAMVNIVSALGAAQATPTLFAVAAVGSPAIQAAAGGELAVLIGAGSLTGPTAIASIVNALSAQSLTADQGVAVLAGMVASGNATAQSAALAEIVALVTAGTVGATQATADVGNALPGATALSALFSLTAAGSPAIQAAAGAEIAALIAANAVTAAQAMAAVGSAITAHTLTGDQAVAVLAGAVAAGNLAVQVAAIGEIATLLKSGAITYPQAIVDLDAAVAGGRLGADQAIAVLVNMAAVTGISGVAYNNAGTPVIEAAVGVEIAALVANNRITAAQAMADLGSAIAAKTITADAGMVILAGAMANGTPALAAAAVGEIATLVAANAITAAAATTDIAYAAMYSGPIPPDQAVKVLAEIAAYGNAALQDAALTQIVTLSGSSNAQVVADIDGLIRSNVLSGAQGVAILVNLAGRLGNTTTYWFQTAAELPALINGGLVTAAQVISTIDSVLQSYPNLYLPGLLWPIVGQCNTAAQFAAGTELAVFYSRPNAYLFDDVAGLVQGTLNADHAVIASVGMAAAGLGMRATQGFGAIVQYGHATMAQVLTDIVNAVSTGAITGTQAFSALSAMAASGGTGAAPAMAEIVTLLNSNAISGVQGVAAVEQAVTTNAMTAAQALAPLAAIAAASASAPVQAAAGIEMASLVTRNLITPSAAISAVASAVSSNLLPGDRAIGLLAGLAGANAAALVPAVLEMYSLIVNGKVPGDVIADIGNAIGPNGLTADQGVAVLVSYTAHCGRWDGAGAEIAALIGASALTAAQAMADIGNAVANGAIDGGGAVYLLANVAVGGGAGVQSAVLGEIIALINSNAVTPTSATIDILHAVSGAQAANLLVALAAADPAILSAAAAAFAQMISYQPQAMPAITAAVAAHTMSVDQAFSFLAACPGHEAPIGAEIAALVANGALTAAQAMSKLDNAVASQALTGDRAVRILAGAAPAAGMQGAVAGEIVALIGEGAITAPEAMTSIAAGSSSADASFALLAAVAAVGNTSILLAAGAEIRAIMGYGPTVVTDTAQAVSAGVLTGDQAVSLLAVVAGATTGQGTTISYLITGIAGLISSGAVSAESAVADIAAVALAGGLGGDAAISIMLGATGGSVPQAITAQVLTLLSHNLTTPSAATSDIVSWPDWSPNDPSSYQAMASAAVNTVLHLYASGGAGLQAAIASGIARGALWSDAWMAGIDAAAGAGVLSGPQAVSLLVGIVGAFVPTLIAGRELAMLIRENVIAPAAAMNQFTTAVAASGLSGDDAIRMLVGVAEFGNAAAQVAAGAEVVTLIGNGTVTTGQAIADIDFAKFYSSVAGAPYLLPDAAAMMLAGLVANGSVSIQAAATAEMLALGATPDIHGAVSAGALTPAQAVAVIANLELAGSSDVQAWAATQFNALVSGGSVTAAAAGAAAIATVESVNAYAHVSVDAGLVHFDHLVGGNAAVESEVATRLTNGAAIADMKACMALGTLTVAQAIAIAEDAARTVRLWPDQTLTQLDQALGGNADIEAELAARLAGGAAAADLAAVVQANNMTLAAAIAAIEADATACKASQAAALGGLYAALSEDTTVQKALLGVIKTDADMAAAIAGIENASRYLHYYADYALLTLDQHISGGNAVLEAEMWTRLANGLATYDLAAAVQAGKWGIPFAVNFIESEARQVHALVDWALIRLDDALGGSPTVEAEIAGRLDSGATFADLRAALGTQALAVVDNGHATAADALAVVERAATLGGRSIDATLLAMNRAWGGNNATIAAEISARLSDWTGPSSLAGDIHAGRLTGAQALAVLQAEAQLVNAPAANTALAQTYLKIVDGEITGTQLSAAVQQFLAQTTDLTWNAGLNSIATRAVPVVPIYALTALAAAVPGNASLLNAIEVDLLTGVGQQQLVSTFINNGLTGDQIMHVLDNALTLLQQAPSGTLFWPLLPGNAQAQYCLAKLEDAIAATKANSLATDPSGASWNNLNWLDTELNQHYGVSLALGHTIVSLVELIGQTAAANAVQYGLQMGSTENVGNPAQQTYLLNHILAAGGCVDASLALANLAAAGQSEMLLMTMTGRLLSGAAQTSVLGLIQSSQLTLDKGIQVLGLEVNAIAASNPHGVALGFDAPTAFAMAVAQLDLAAASTGATQIQQQIEWRYHKDVVTGLGAVLGLLRGETSAAAVAQMQVAGPILNNLLGTDLRTVLYNATLSGQLQGPEDSAQYQQEEQALSDSVTQGFHDAYEKGAELHEFVKEQKFGAEDPTITGDISTHTFLSTGTSADAATSITLSLGGGLGLTGAASAGAQASAGISATGVQANASAGALASMTLNIGDYAKMQEMAQALADGSVSAGLNGVSVKASVGLRVGIEISQTNNFSMGEGLSGSQTTTFDEQATIGASGEAKLGQNGLSATYGAKVGAFVSITEDYKADLGAVGLDAAATLMSPGVLGLSANIKLGIDNGKIDLGMNLFLGLGIGGIDFSFDITIDTSVITNAGYTAASTLGNAIDAAAIAAWNAVSGAAQTSYHAVADTLDEAFSWL